MNIFVTSDNPLDCARYLDNKRKIKMALESTQMLCTALNLNGVSTPYKTAHPRHPCTVWVTESRNNWRWLYDHAIALCNEYTRIYGKVHKCLSILQSINGLEIVLPDTPRTPFKNCARNKEFNLDYTTESDVYSAYRAYLNARWERDKLKPIWTQQ